MDRDDQQTQSKAMRGYIEHGMSAPEFWTNPDDDPVGDRQRCPGEWHLVLQLIQSGVCKTESEAWDYPYNRAMCWVAVIGETKGSKDYVDKLDREQIDMVNNGNTD